jgi:hypothetical protein
MTEVMVALGMFLVTASRAICDWAALSTSSSSFDKE